MEKVKELKKIVLGEGDNLKRKRKLPKAPNPLSCKKKKPKIVMEEKLKNIENHKTEKKRRKRIKKRKINQATLNSNNEN